MSEFIPYARHSVSEADIDAVVRVLRSDWLTQGPSVPSFEADVSKRCKAGYAVAVNSATSALHIACVALDVGPEDSVWTSPNTFVASANCARFCGAQVDFVDIDPDTWCLSVKRLKDKLELHKSKGMRLPKVVIPVHLSGQSCDMRAVKELGNQFGFKIIEDASHALGASYFDEPVGSCSYSDITVFSLHPAKIITTGEGGLLLTNDSAIQKRLVRLRSHGITRDTNEMIRKSTEPWYYEQLELGFNYRMNDIQAALGLSQLKRLEVFVDRRNEIARRYDHSLSKISVTKQEISTNIYSSRHLYIIRVPKKKHLSLFETLLRHGIGVNLHYTPVHLQPYYQNLGFQKGDYPEAEAYGCEAISLPIYSDLSNGDQDYVIETLKKHI